MSYTECDISVSRLLGNFPNFLDGIRFGIKKIGIEKSIGFSIEKIWYNKVSDLVLKKWYQKKYWIRYQNFWYQIKVSNSVLEIFCIEKSIGFGIKKITKKSWICLFETWFCRIWYWYQYRFQNYSIFLDGIGYGIEKIWYQKKYRIRYQQNLVSKKYWIRWQTKIGIEKTCWFVQILGIVTHWSYMPSVTWNVSHCWMINTIFG